MVVCHGEWEAVLSVPGADLALEVRTPHGVWRVCHQGDCAGMLVCAASAFWLGETLPLQQIPDGRSCGESKFWLTLGEVRQELLWPPGRVLLTGIKQSLLHLRRHLVRAGTGGMALVFEAVEWNFYLGITATPRRRNGYVTSVTKNENRLLPDDNLHQI